MDFAARYGPWALVTGASSGLGACFARDLAGRGLDLVLVARRADRLEALAAELEREHGRSVRSLPMDLCAEDAAEALHRGCDGLEIGLLVNNAGFGATGAFLADDPDRDARMVRLNCEAVVRTSHLFLPAMAERGRGGMVVVASTASFQPCPWMAVYGATKAFDLHLAEALAVELEPRGVDVLAVCPGHTDTEFHAIAGVKGPVAGGSADPAAVVKGALDRLGRRQTWVPGWLNRCMSWAPRFGPRRLTARLTGRLLASRMIA
ncbi:MAG: SDR family oxidoreductase [Planctomycetota bacterium]|nr:MAG: SDR family oxidoreductase [Planctomycetota bacterium]